MVTPMLTATQTWAISDFCLLFPPRWYYESQVLEFVWAASYLEAVRIYTQTLEFAPEKIGHRKKERYLDNAVFYQ